MNSNIKQSSTGQFVSQTTFQAASEFKPKFGLANPHVQTIFSSVGPLKKRVSHLFKPYSNAEQTMLFDGGDGIRLRGYYNKAVQAPAEQLVILIHGWEGSHASSYIQSMAMTLLEKGVDVVRLNLRDHGDTHALNEGIFNSTLIDEFVNAVENLQSQLKYKRNHLVGFSLGGNFSLRLAAKAHNHKITLDNVIAFCPAIHAARSNVVLNQPRNWLYGRYFVRKWKRSLRKKLAHWPHYQFGLELDEVNTLDEMNIRFIPKYTAFDDVDEYFDAYAITGNCLDSTVAPCHLHFAEDDMIIPIEDVRDISANPNLNIVVTKHGGHCGYILNWRGDNWQDKRVLEILGLD